MMRRFAGSRLSSIRIDRHSPNKADQLRSRSERIEHLKLMVEKFRHMIFGTKSEKLVLKLEQMEFELEEDETTQAEGGSRSPNESRRCRNRSRVPSGSRCLNIFRAKSSRTCSRARLLPRLRWQSAPIRRRCLRTAGVRSGELQGHPPCAAEVHLHSLRSGRSSSGAFAAYRARPCGTGSARPCAGLEVCRSSTALFRQSEIYAREGVDSGRSTLAGWVGATSELLAPLVEAVRNHVMAASKLHADDTPVPVLAPGNGKTKTGRLWTYVRDDRPAGEQTAPAVWFAYSQDRKGEHPRQHLKHFTGALQADAYAGFQHLYGERIYSKSPAGLMPGASSTRSISSMLHRPQPKRWTASPHSMRSKTRSVASLPRSGRAFGRHGPNPCSTTCTPGWKGTSPPLPQERDRGCDPLRPLTLAGAHPLCR